MILSIFTYISWLTNCIGAIGALESSNTSQKANLFKINLCFFLANLYSVFYFTLTWQPSYIFIQSIYLILAIRGLFNNKRKKELSIKDT
jgi:hypothetical protein